MALAALVVAAVMYAAFTWPTPTGLWRQVGQHPTWSAVLPVALVLAAYVGWTVRRIPRARRPLLLVIDDLDRCGADRVVKLLETVHTLLRERPDLRLFPRWRRPAPLVVLALGDGRWIRQSFETAYASHASLGSAVHGLGADFLQKVFDHVVLVPSLSADQTRAFIADVTHTSPWALAAARAETPAPPPASESSRASPSPVESALPVELRPPPTAQTAAPAPSGDGSGAGGNSVSPAPQLAAPIVAAGQPAVQAVRPAADADPAMPAAGQTTTADPAPATATAHQLIAATSAGQVHSDEVRDAIDQAPSADRQQLAEEVAAKAASPQAIKSFSEHLLARFAPVMPANPRLVTRVANAFGMLMALQLQLGRRDPEDLIARAAIMFVRFPTLVDQLLSEPDPPAIDPTTAPANSRGTSPWLRPDVQQVLRDQHGTPIDIVTLAGCYGREYAPAVAALAVAAPAVAAPERPQAAESSPSSQPGGQGR